MVRERIVAAGAPVARIVVALAWPLMLASGLGTLLQTMAHVWIGRLVGVAGLAVVSIMAPLELTIGNLLQVAPRGAAVMVSRSVGGKTGDGMNLIASASALQLIWTGVLGAVLLVLIDPLARLLSGDLAIAAPLRSYLTAWAFSVPALGITLVLTASLNATGYTKIGLWRMVVSTLFLTAALPLFIDQLGLGVAGAPIANIVLAVPLCAICVGIAVRWADSLGLGRFRRSPIRTELGRWRTMLAIGAPAQLARIGQFVAMSLLVRLPVHDSEVATAGFGIAIRLLAMGAALTVAVAGAASIMIGQNIGAGNAPRARVVLRSSFVLTTVGAAVLVVAGSLARPVVALFSDDPHTIAAAVDALDVLRWSFVPVAAYQLLLAAFEAAGRTAVASIVILAADAAGVGLAYALEPSVGSAAWGVTVAAGIKAVLLVALIPHAFLRPLRSIAAAHRHSPSAE